MAFFQLVKQILPSLTDAIVRRVSGVDPMPEDKCTLHEIARCTPANKISPLGFRSVASRLLQNDPNTCSRIDELLKSWDIDDAKFLGGGSISLVLDSGRDTILRVTPHRIDNARLQTDKAVEILQEETVGDFRVQEITKLSTDNVTWTDVWRTQIALMKDGKLLLDVGKDNIGHRVDGVPLVIDHGSVIERTGSLAPLFQMMGRGLERATGIEAKPETWRVKASGQDHHL